MPAGIEILNTAGGDIRIEFQESERDPEVESSVVVMSDGAAAQLLRDLQRRGYAILVRMPDGSYSRALEIDPDRAVYRVRIPSEPAADEWPDPEERAVVAASPEAPESARQQQQPDLQRQPDLQQQPAAEGAGPLKGTARLGAAVDALGLDLQRTLTDEEVARLAEQSGLAPGSVRGYVVHLRRERQIPAPKTKGPRVGRSAVQEIPVASGQATVIARSAGG